MNSFSQIAYYQYIFNMNIISPYNNNISDYEYIKKICNSILILLCVFLNLIHNVIHVIFLIKTKCEYSHKNVIYLRSNLVLRYNFSFSVLS